MNHGQCSELMGGFTEFVFYMDIHCMGQGVQNIHSHTIIKVMCVATLPCTFKSPRQTCQTFQLLHNRICYAT